MAYTRESVLEAYQRLGNLRAACTETGAPPYVAFIWCKKAGVMTTADKSRYGTKAQQQGAGAEAEFQRLVPFALPANTALVKNCPGFDFDVDGVTVDVKFSILRSRGNWGFDTAKHKHLPPDLYALFLCTHESGDIKDGYRLLIIPHDTVGDRSHVTLRPGSISDLWSFEINPADLATLLAVEEAA